ncbi:MAG: ParB N-terminal domain-containing protein [Rhizobacter sp.]|nr:ParB N-terminal domain-containing protein [Bacteriovorax sp.]
MEVRRLNDLKATNPYLRLGTDVSELEKSISTVGLIAPLVISPDNVILAGARRYQALLNLGFTEAPVMVVDKGALEMELVSIDENLVRKDLSKIEVEGHLRRAKEIYQALNPQEEIKTESSTVEGEEKKQVLPAEKFLIMVSEKTGLSPKQIHEAINRDEMASSNVKEARKNGDLSLSQTNEIVKLTKDEQKKSLSHLKGMPVREIKSFVKIAKAKGVEAAIKETHQDPNARDFVEIEVTLKKLLKKFKQFELEGITLDDLPEQTQKLFNSVMKFSNPDAFYASNGTEFVEDSLQ